MPDSIKELPVISDYRKLLRDGTPLLDVRAPVEFDKGAFPNTTNMPLLADDERHQIGIEYKEEGHDAAVDLGKKLISGEIKNERVAAWTEYVKAHPEGALYCFRGGMRSRITQMWIEEATGIAYPRIEGGYKALRRYLVDQLESDIPEQINPVVIGGRTGVGKTRLLVTLPHHIDLEGLARHRGSAFGNYAIPQPTQIEFENRLAIELIRLIDSGHQAFAVEDESRNVGRVHLNQELHDRFASAPLVILEASLDERVEITFDEYVTEALAEFRNLHGDDAGFDAWKSYVTNAFSRIRRRLGGERHQIMMQQIETAMQLHHDQNRPDAHKAWIADLLENYYDPMYDYQLSKKQQRIIFSGNRKAVADFLHTRLPH
jgi:tRNA 2-selenouridine synthase